MRLGRERMECVAASCVHLESCLSSKFPLSCDFGYTGLQFTAGVSPGSGIDTTLRDWWARNPGSMLYPSVVLGPASRTRVNYFSGEGSQSNIPTDIGS
jgi:hypothetical protein